MDTHIHLYKKHDLAMAYFPNLKAPAAERKLRRWINENPYLIKRLKSRGYKTFCKTLSRSQLDVVFEAFGEP